MCPSDVEGFDNAIEKIFTEDIMNDFEKKYLSNEVIIEEVDKKDKKKKETCSSKKKVKKKKTINESLLKKNSKWANVKKGDILIDKNGDEHVVEYVDTAKHSTLKKNGKEKNVQTEYIIKIKGVRDELSEITADKRYTIKKK